MSNRLPPETAPETFALHGGYDPARSEGALKPPVFHTSTFVAPSAEQLAAWFRQGYGLDGAPPRAPDGLIYSRLVNPNLQIAEERWARFEGAQCAALFASGMAAISTTLLTLLRPGDAILYTAPVYGGTDFFLNQLLAGYGIKTEAIPVGASAQEVLERALQMQSLPKVVYIESPANPTLEMADLRGICARLREVSPRPVVVVDATILGPLFERPIELGADLVVHSATKSIGGHSDLLCGIVSGSGSVMDAVKATRTILGTMSDPQTAWLILRSLEDYKVRVEAASHKAKKVVRFLREHKAVERVYYPGAGSLLSFTVRGAQEEAYRVLNALRVVKLAVSLGGTESLAEHPRTHTHSDIQVAQLDRLGITSNMIRLSVGLEDADDVIADLQQALLTIQ